MMKLMRLWIRLFLVCLAATSVPGCGKLPTGPSGELINTVFHVEGTVSSSKDGSAISGATVSLGIDTVSGLVQTKTVSVDAMGRYVLEHSFNLGKDTCPSLWLASSASGYASTTPRDSRYRVACGVPNQTINISLVP
jgi:hypothetical protein